MVHIENVEKPVPFGQSLFVQFGIHDIHPNDLSTKSHIERSYLAWETVRKKTNPYFEEGTGFEGYLVGTCPDSDAALQAILKASQHLLDAIARLYHFESYFRSRLMRTLDGEIDDPESIHIWSAYLGAELGRLRVRIPHNKAAILFQNQTYQIVTLLPPITYRPVESGVIQNYGVGYVDNAVMVVSPNQPRITVKEKMLNSSQQTAWMVAKNIGRFGHPLVRQFLDRVF
ncbi:MAG: hypothetical protein GC179_11070 [Anaerolineaceae bacterium]|nr:hypothetical protein [Anaerolineaceae bacterium]